MRVAENATQKQLIQCLSHVAFKKVVLSNFHRDIFTKCCLSLFLSVFFPLKPAKTQSLTVNHYSFQVLQY